jgi:hypothetical protein
MGHEKAPRHFRARGADGAGCATKETQDDAVERITHACRANAPEGGHALWSFFLWPLIGHGIEKKEQQEQNRADKEQRNRTDSSPKLIKTL